MRGYVSRLRCALRSGPSGEDRVVTRKPGYLLRVEESELDLHRFERLVDDARVAVRSGRPQHSFELLAGAQSCTNGSSTATRAWRQAREPRRRPRPVNSPVP